MTIQKRIMLASVLSVVVSALLIAVFWAGYEHFNKRIIVYPVRRASDGGDRLTETINVLYTIEVELSAEMEWKDCRERRVKSMIWSFWMSCFRESTALRSAVRSCAVILF